MRERLLEMKYSAKYDYSAESFLKNYCHGWPTFPHLFPICCKGYYLILTYLFFPMTDLYSTDRLNEYAHVWLKNILNISSLNTDTYIFSTKKEKNQSGHSKTPIVWSSNNRGTKKFALPQFMLLQFMRGDKYSHHQNTLTFNFAEDLF